jgi:hypothetical protein
MGQRYICLTILEGTSELDAEPVLVSDDPGLLAAVAREIDRRLGAAPEAARVLELVRGDDARSGGDDGGCDVRR